MLKIHSRYLTAPEKEYVLKQLEEELARGWVDEEIIPYLEELNQIQGVVTTQSCAGHDDGRVGYISIRLSERMNELFLRHIDYLFKPERSLYQYLAGVEQHWECFKSGITGEEVARPRWVFWFEPESRDEFLKGLSRFLFGLSQIDR